MYIVFLIIAVVVIISSMVIWTMHMSKESNQKMNDGNNIIGNFEPGNIAPTLSEMIEFHKKNGVVDYDI